MAVYVYREGNTHVVDGVECEAQLINPARLENHLDIGWVVDPKELVKAQIDTNKSGKLSTAEIREAAKGAGIEGWDTKRVKTLKNELGL